MRRNIWEEGIAANKTCAIDVIIDFIASVPSFQRDKEISQQISLSCSWSRNALLSEILDACKDSIRAEHLVVGINSAASMGNLEGMRIIEEFSPGIFTEHADEISIYGAATAGKTECLEYILGKTKTVKDFNVSLRDAKNECFSTLLPVAGDEDISVCMTSGIGEGRIDNLKTLMDSGMQSRVREDDAATAIKKNASAGRVETLRLLAEAFPEACRSKEGESSALWLAEKNGKCSEKIKEILYPFADFSKEGSYLMLLLEKGAGNLHELTERTGTTSETILAALKEHGGNPDLTSLFEAELLLKGRISDLKKTHECL